MLEQFRPRVSQPHYRGRPKPRETTARNDPEHTERHRPSKAAA